MKTTALWCVLALGSLGGLTGCEERTPTEKIEDAAKDMGDAAGDAAEDLGDAIEEATDDAADAVEDAADAVKDAVDQD